MRGYTAYGGFLGFCWYLIKDQICLPHGTDTYFRTLLAYSLMGGVIFGTLIHPANIIFGCGTGLMFGGFKDGISRVSLPRNFELKMNFVDQERRQKLLREDEEYELSMRNVLTTRPDLTTL